MNEESKDNNQIGGIAALKRGGGGLAKYASESRKFDMSDIDNHYRFL